MNLLLYWDLMQLERQLYVGIPLIVLSICFKVFSVLQNVKLE